MKPRETHIVPHITNPIRFQEYGLEIFEAISTKSTLKKTIKKGLITINDIAASTATFITGSEKIVLYYPKIQLKRVEFSFNLEIIYEDDFLAIINKPPGILVSGNKLKTIANSLASNLKESKQPDKLLRPMPVHRLDFPTSGLLLVAKTNRTLVLLGNMFKDQKISKTYHAITAGSMKNEGIINTLVDDKEAITNYMVQERQVSNNYDFLNLVRLYPKTGRRHQLRIHLSSIGNPILGDSKYGDEGHILKGKGLFLCASALKFEHPITKEMLMIDIPLPSKFSRIFY